MPHQSAPQPSVVLLGHDTETTAKIRIIVQGVNCIPFYRVRAEERSSPFFIA